MNKCTLPPAGWECSREPGHSGPCAATPAPSAETASETPRCDALQFTSWCPDQNKAIQVVRLPFAKDLERELTQAQADLRAAQQERDERDFCPNCGGKAGYDCACSNEMRADARLVSRVKELRAKLDASEYHSAEQVKALGSIYEEQVQSLEEQLAATQQALDAARERLRCTVATLAPLRAAISAAIAGEKS